MVRTGIEQAERAVERTAEVDLGDHVRLRIGPWRRHDDGNRPLTRTNVLCRIGQRPLIPPFGLDIVTGPPPPLAPEIAPPLQPLQAPGDVGDRQGGVDGELKGRATEGEPGR
jgi:hypothetical protein